MRTARERSIVVHRPLAAFLAAIMVTSSAMVAAGASASVNTHPLSPIAQFWTEPQSGYGFFLDAVSGAHRSIDLSMYELSDAALESGLIARARAGVSVRVLLNSAYEGQEENAAAYAALRAGGVHAEWAPSEQIFHAKYMVVDGSRAYIGTGNLVESDYSSTRDFWVMDTSAPDVAAIVATFDADFSRSGAQATDAGGLVWSPGSTSDLVDLIDSAHHTLLVENEEMDSAPIEAALAATAERGVSVYVVMTFSSSWQPALENLARQGVHVRTLDESQVYIHAKVICADCSSADGTVFVGSENFSTSSLSYNRELGVITATPTVVRAVMDAVESDYRAGTPVTTPVTTPTTSSPSGSGVTITGFAGSIGAGAEDSLSVHSTRPDDECDLEIVLPSGYTSESEGLGAARANASGNVTWTWRIGTSTRLGTATANVTCGAGRVSRTFAIT